MIFQELLDIIDYPLTTLDSTQNETPSISREQNNNETASEVSTSSSENQNIPTSINTVSDLALENKKDTIDLSKLPQSLTVIAESADSDFPLGTARGTNSSVQAETITDIPSSIFEFRDWNPKFTFQFIEGSDVGLQNVKSVLIGQLKSYNSIEDALKNAKLWKNIPLNEQSVLRLDHKGLNFIIVEVDFTNSVYGLYSGVFDMQSSLDKKAANGILKK